MILADLNDNQLDALVDLLLGLQAGRLAYDEVARIFNRLRQPPPVKRMLPYPVVTMHLRDHWRAIGERPQLPIPIVDSTQPTPHYAWPAPPPGLAHERLKAIRIARTADGDPK